MKLPEKQHKNVKYNLFNKVYVKKKVLFLIKFNFFANPIKLQVSWLIKGKKTKCNLIDNECS